MERERLFSFAVVKHPTKEEVEKGVRALLIVAPCGYFLAKNEDEAAMKAARSIPEEFMDCADRLEVAVRPF